MSKTHRKMTRRSLTSLALLSLLLIYSCNNDDEPGVDLLDIIAEETEVLEGNERNTVTFQLKLTEASEDLVTVKVSTEDFTAKAGEDYEAFANQTIAFDPGDTIAQVALVILGDEVEETDEYLYINLSEPVNADLPMRQFRIKIINDEGLLEIPTSGPDSPMEYDGYTLVWNDEFNQGSLNAQNWTFDLGTGFDGGWGNGELQYYTQNNHYFAENDYLVIEAREENFGGRNYTSTRLKTQGKQSFTYGRVDIRASMPEGQGLWPALWTLGANIEEVNWPRCGEIDIMEMKGSDIRTVHGTAHWQSNSGKADFSGTRTLPTSNLHDAFHVYTIEWDESSITWYIDDVQYHQLNTAPADMDEFRKPHFFIMNIAVGGWFGGNPNATTTFPQHMIVDYIRVFQKN